LLGEKKYTDGIIAGWMSATKQETEKQKLPQYLKLISIYLLCVCVCAVQLCKFAVNKSKQAFSPILAANATFIDFCCLIIIQPLHGMASIFSTLWNTLLLL